MKLPLLVVLAVLAGCASTPNEVRQQGVPVNLTTTDNLLDRVARCIQQNAENASGDMHARVNGSEVVVRLDNGTWISPGTIAVFDIRSLKPGQTAITGWVKPIIGNDAESLTRIFMRGC